MNPTQINRLTQSLWIIALALALNAFALSATTFAQPSDSKAPNCQPEDRGQDKKSENHIKVYSTVLAPKDVADIFGRRIAKRFIAIQVTIANHNRDLQFLIHDVTINRCKGGSGSDNKDFLSRVNEIVSKADIKLSLNAKLMKSISSPPVSASGGGNSFRMSSIDIKLLRGVAEKGYALDPRNLTIRLLRGAGAIAGGIMGVTTFGASYAPSMAAFNGPFITSVERTFPDFTLNQVNRLNDVAYESNSLVPRQQAKIMVVFVPQSFYMDKQQMRQFYDDPGALEEALQLLAAVIDVEGTFVEELEGQPPLVTDYLIDGAESKKFQSDKPEVHGILIGRFLSGAKIGFSGPAPEGMNVAIKDTPTFNNLEFTLTSDHPVPSGQPIKLLIANKTGDQRYSFEVSYTAERPTITSIAPGEGNQGASVKVTIEGSGFFKNTNVFISGSGAKVEDVKFESTKKIIATVKIESNAAVGDQELRVSTVGGVSDGKKFKIKAPQ